MTRLTDDEIATLRQRLAEAKDSTDPPGKWVPREPVTPQRELLVAAVNALPQLLYEVSSLRAENARLTVDRDAYVQLMADADAARFAVQRQLSALSLTAGCALARAGRAGSDSQSAGEAPMTRPRWLRWIDRWSLRVAHHLWIVRWKKPK